MAAHNKPAGLPIHPECSALGDGGAECTCDIGYRQATDLDRAIEVAERLEGRSNPCVYPGRGPDADEAEGRARTSSKVFSDATPDNDYGVTTVERGFWKESEDLRCKAGKDFARGPLNYDRFKGDNWERAKS